jgi:DNA-binding NarL/FixJ family response regulator
MIAVLHRLNRIQMEVVELADTGQLKTSLARLRPDVLIVNPSALGTFSLQQIKKEIAHDNLKCIALQSSLYDNAALKIYDEVISIYDSADQISEKLTKLIIDPDIDRRHESLTLREKEIIICVIKGMTNKQIADKLYLSTHTVVSHRRNIAMKLQIHSTAGLTIYAIVNKLVELDDIKDTSPASE